MIDLNRIGVCCTIGWHGGELRAWRRDVDGWLAVVRYAVSPGMRHLEWVDAERVRPA